MCFDKIITKKFTDEVIIEYGIVKGSSCILLIKVGRDGDIYGYENKYLKISKNINEKYGFSIVVASNFYTKEDSLENSIRLINEEFDSCREIYFMGYSSGAIFGAKFAYLHPEIKKLLLINGPLMINWIHTKRGIERFKGDEVVFIYGSKDPSFRYIGLIDFINSIAKISIVSINGADHNFSKMIERFHLLPEEYLFK